MARQTPQLKLVLVGDESVGKTSILNKWIGNPFDMNAAPTIGGASQSRRDVIEGEPYFFQIWDTAGAERYRALAPLYARDAKAALVVFDLTRRRTFESLSDWVTFLRQQGEIPFIIVGNKSDLTAQQEVSAEEATNFAYSVNGQYWSTSAKTGENLDLVMKQLEIEAITLYKRQGPGEGATMVEIESNGPPPKESGCC
jgi:small GTP-binding protein